MSCYLLKLDIQFAKFVAFKNKCKKNELSANQRNKNQNVFQCAKQITYLTLIYYRDMYNILEFINEIHRQLNNYHIVERAFDEKVPM